MIQMAAIPTVYAGVQFRSRLEAKWAAMFDLLDWKWEYEPFDLNGYIPDFMLGFATPMLVEVKPLTGAPWTWDDEPLCWEALDKIRRSGWDGEGLIVGTCLSDGADAMGYTPEPQRPINGGLLFERRPETDAVYTGTFAFKSCCGGPVDVVGSFHCRKCGDHDKGPTILSSSHITRLWREAGNRVQWRSPRAQVR